MSRTARLWRGAVPLAWGGLLLTGALARADDPAPPPPLAEQLVGLARQAIDQGRPAEADQFLRRAREIDPTLPALIRLAALQDPAPGGEPAPPPPVPAPADEPVPADQPGAATIERANQVEQALLQQATADIRDRIDQARALVRQGQPGAALDVLRLALTAVDSADQIPDRARRDLRRQVESEYRQTLRREEEFQQDRASRLRLEASAAQAARALEALNVNEVNIKSLMTQFDALMEEGRYNVLYSGGAGDIRETTQPFFDAQLLANQARAMDPTAPAPRAGIFVAQSIGFLAQTLSYEQLKEYRFLLTLLDVERAAIPFPDTLTIEYPDAETFRELSERRIKRYESVDLVDRSPQTLSILEKLDQPISMPFENETTLEDAIRYIKQATAGPNDTGIPIYIDPIGLLEAERTMQSPVTMNLEGVPLKTAMRLLLKQLDLTYTVKDGLLTITFKDSTDQPTEIRVYPVADLAIIPLSLLGGGGGGGQGGGLGGGGGGLGGGGGGLGGGGGGGFRSIPAEADDLPALGSQKKSR